MTCEIAKIEKISPNILSSSTSVMIMGEVKPKIIIPKEWRLVGHHRQRQGQGAREPWPPQHFRPCLVFFFFGHSLSLITHHSKIPYLFGTITHFPSLNIFHTICEPHTYHPVQLFFFFLQYPNSSNLVKKRRKRRRSRNPEQTEPVKEEGKKNKKRRRRNPGEERTEQPTQRRKEKKKVKSGQKLQLGTICRSPMCV